MRVTYIIAALAGLLLIAGAAPEPPPEVAGYRGALLALDRQFWQASAKGDVEAIGRMVAEDYVGIDQDQHRWTRPALLEQFRRIRTSHLRRHGEREVIGLTEHSAVLTYEAEYKVHLGEGGGVVDSGRLRMSSCWVRREGAWVVVFSQVSAVAGGEPVPISASPIKPAVLDPPAPDGPDSAGDGVQFVVGLADRERKTFAVGEPIRIDVKVRNVTNRNVEGHFADDQLFYAEPEVEDAAGLRVKVSPPTVLFGGAWASHPYRLGPGDETSLGTAVLVFTPDGPGADAAAGDARTYCVAHAGPGTYRVSYFGAEAVDVRVK